jgi:hypothetical protein
VTHCGKVVPEPEDEEDFLVDLFRGGAGDMFKWRSHLLSRDAEEISDGEDVKADECT